MIGQAVLKTINGDKHMYSPGAGTDTPGSLFLYTHKPSFHPMTFQQLHEKASLTLSQSRSKSTQGYHVYIFVDPESLMFHAKFQKGGSQHVDSPRADETTPEINSVIQTFI